ncbi:FecR family protein [Terrihabitans soli]|uniref:FecR family protein n=1 Tax=Terrihabitans soli TaxID=708113 RepID=UPI001CA3435C|nr:FecR family protein [Terrihabitans soli]
MRASQSALEEAAEWFFRQDGKSLPESERALFETWLAIPENRSAWAEIGRTWQEARGLDYAAGRAVPGISAPVRWMAIAASLVLALLGAGYAFDLPMRLRADIYTATGEFRSVTLPDGSIAQINTGSALALHFSPKERIVRLLKGEAVFTVAHDGSRPFMVQTDGDTATALGTVFAVRETGEGAVVTVLESRVAVAFADGGPRRELAPGQQVRPLGGGHEITNIDADAATAWRRGKLIFADRPLGSVVEELNRYHMGRIQIVDPALNSRRVSGVFDTSDPLAVVAALEASLQLSSTRIGSMLVLLHR